MFQAVERVVKIKSFAILSSSDETVAPNSFAIFELFLQMARIDKLSIFESKQDIINNVRECIDGCVKNFIYFDEVRLA